MELTPDVRRIEKITFLDCEGNVYPDHNSAYKATVSIRLTKLIGDNITSFLPSVGGGTYLMANRIAHHIVREFLVATKQ